MAAAVSDPQHALKGALEAFETCLTTPIVGGELITWIGEVQKAWSELSDEIHRCSMKLHPRQYEQISKEDPELLPRIEKLRAEDVEIENDREALGRFLQRMVELAPKAGPDEERIRELTTALVEEGVSLVNRTRKQEVAVQTWFVEAFNRDRGVAD